MSDKNPNPFVAKWSADGHTLCLGHWVIHFKGQLIQLPYDRSTNYMNTLGNFSWLFPDDDAFVEGLNFENWIEDNIDWLLVLFEQYAIPIEPDYLEWFYEAVNLADWRCSSCGGCM